MASKAVGVQKKAGAFVRSVNSLASLVNMFTSETPTKASLVPLDSSGNEKTSWERAFQYFPTTISDTKGINYAIKQIPGGSHPLYQFVNGSERIISFDAIFTSDENPDPVSVVEALAGGLELNVGNWAAKKFFDKKKVHNAPVESAVIWLRSFMYPSYQDGGVVPPPVLRLYLPNSRIHGSTNGGSLIVDSIDVLMTQCDVSYDSFYQNGRQRITVVKLSFYETIQVGDNWQFSSSAYFNRVWNLGMNASGKPMDKYDLKSNRMQEALKIPGTNVKVF